MKSTFFYSDRLNIYSSDDEDEENDSEKEDKLMKAKSLTLDSDDEGGKDQDF